MKSSPIIFSMFLVLLAGCGKSSNEEQITALETKIRLEEEKIRGSKTNIVELRRQIAQLGGDTLVVSESVFVTVLPVKKGDYSEFVDIAAIVSSRENLLISSDMGGRIISMRVREGQRVGRGQILAELDGELIRKRIAELENALSLAKTVFDKRKALWDQRIGSEVEYLQAENNLQSLEKSMATANAQLDKVYVRSPISGTVDKVIINTGEMAGPGQPMMRVVNLDRVQVKADVSEAYLGKIATGDVVSLNFPSIGLKQEAKISAVGQVIDPNNRTFTLEAELSNPGGILKPNLVGSISMKTDFEAAQVLVPTRLVQSDFSGSYVYVVDSVSNISLKREVVLGSSYGGQSVISEGLNGGEWLIDEGYRNVSDSSTVQIQKF